MRRFLVVLLVVPLLAAQTAPADEGTILRTAITATYRAAEGVAMTLSMNG